MVQRSAPFNRPSFTTFIVIAFVLLASGVYFSKSAVRETSEQMQTRDVEFLKNSPLHPPFEVKIGSARQATVLVQETTYGPPSDPGLYELEVDENTHLFALSRKVPLKKYVGKTVNASYRNVEGVVMGEQQLVLVDSVVEVNPPTPPRTIRGLYNDPEGRFHFRYPDEFMVQNSTTLTTENGSILVTVLPDMDTYKLLDNPGGFMFKYNRAKKEWAHTDGIVDEFVPTRTETRLEAYLYESGDVKCTIDYILIPHPTMKWGIEIHNTICGTDEVAPNTDLQTQRTNQILTSFSFDK